LAKEAAFSFLGWTFQKTIGKDQIFHCGEKLQRQAGETLHPSTIRFDDHFDQPHLFIHFLFIVSPGQVRDNFQRILCFSWIVGDVRGARNLQRRAMSFFLKKERRIEQCHEKA
jgi:hypothetical protein